MSRDAAPTLDEAPAGEGPWEAQALGLARRLRQAALGVAIVILALDLALIGLASFREEGLTRQAQIALYAAHIALPLGLVVCLVVMRWIDRSVGRTVELTRTSLEQVRAEHARLEAVLQSSIDGVLIIDADGRLLEVNGAAEALLDRRRERVLGRRLQQIPVFSEATVAARLARWLEGETGAPAGERLVVDVPDGSAPRRAELTCYSAGLVESRRLFVINLRDVTEQEEAETALQRSERRHRAVVGALPDLLVHYRENGRIIALHAGAGITPPESMQQAHTLAGAFGAQIAEQLAAIDFTHLPAEPALVEFTYPDAELGERCYEARAVAIDANQRLALVRDVTDQRATETALSRAKEEAEAASRAKTDFLASMSHEIRTPLSAVVGYAGLLTRADRDPEQARRWAEQIRLNAGYLLDLVGGALDLSRIEAGKLRIEKAACDLVELIEEVCALMEPRAREKALDLKLQFDGRMPRTIETDALRLRQVLVNLVSNAIKYTDTGSVTVRIRTETGTRQRHTFLRVMVRDTGIGIAPEKLDLLFSPFEQVHDDPGRRREGFGLGLAIAKQLAELLGGELTASSEPGEGSTFTLTLDVGPSRALVFIEPEAHVSPAPEAPPSPSRQLAGLRVLVADDTESNRDITRYLLEEAGASVLTAENGQLALDRLEAEPAIDLVLLDMQMPVLDGYAAARAIRARGLRVPVIALTAYAMNEDAAHCREAGCDGFLNKPVTPELLVATVRDAAAGTAASAPTPAPRPQGEVAPSPPEARAPEAAAPQSPPPEPAEAAAAPEPSEAPASSSTTGGGMAALQAKYHTWLAEVAGTLATASEQEDGATVAQLAHKLRGTAALYGMPALGEAAGACEDAWREAGRWAALTGPLASLRRELTAATPEARHE